MDFSVSQEGIIIILTFSPRHSKAGVVKPKIQKGGGRDGEQKGFRETRHLGGGEWDLGSDSPARWTSAQIRPTFARERGGLQGRGTPSVGLAAPSTMFLLRPSALALTQTPFLSLQPCSLVSSHPRWLLSYPALPCPETLASWLLSLLIFPEPKSLPPLLVGTTNHKLGPPDLSFPKDLGVQVPSFNFLILLTLRGSQSDTQQKLNNCFRALGK